MEGRGRAGDQGGGGAGGVAARGPLTARPLVVVGRAVRGRGGECGPAIPPRQLAQLESHSKMDLVAGAFLARVVQGVSARRTGERQIQRGKTADAERK